MKLQISKNADVNYLARIVEIKEFTSHPNPEVNRMKIAHIGGYSICVGIDEHYLYPTKLLMRPEGSFLPGPEQKKLIYEREIKNKYYVDFILEDSSKVVKMWRELGLICLQPNEGKF